MAAGLKGIMLWTLIVWAGLGAAWTIMKLITKSPRPIVVAHSTAYDWNQPSVPVVYYRGELLFLDNRSPEFQVNDLVVCEIPGRESHQGMEVIRQIVDKFPIYSDPSTDPTDVADKSNSCSSCGEYEATANVQQSDDSSNGSSSELLVVFQYLTKGVDNRIHDAAGLYPRGRKGLFRHECWGKVVWQVPQVRYLIMIGMSVVNKQSLVFVTVLVTMLAIGAAGSLSTKRTRMNDDRQ